MGHSKSVNAAIYQTPLAEQEVLEVGAILHRFGKASKKMSSFYLKRVMKIVLPLLVDLRLFLFLVLSSLLSRIFELNLMSIKLHHHCLQ
jgi:hypothetical protein